MDSIARIGSSIHIKGEVTASEPLTIAGRVEGTIDVAGHAVTIDPSGRVEATIFADAIIIAGTVQGQLSATARIVVRETATIEGDLSAPSISIAEGAAVHGKVETVKRGETTLPKPSSTSVVRLETASSAA